MVVNNWQHSIKIKNNEVVAKATPWATPEAFKVVNRSTSFTPTRSSFITVKDLRGKMDFGDFLAWDYELIHLPPGTFEIDEHTEAGLYASSVPKVIIGAGKSETTLKMPTQNTNKPALGFFECPKVMLMDLTVDANCNTTVGWSTGVQFNGCDNVALLSVKVKNAGNTGVRLGSGGIPGSGNTMATSSSRTTNFTIYDLEVENTYGPSALTLKSGGAKFGTIKSSTFDGWKSQGISIEGEDLHNTPNTSDPGGWIEIADVNCINATGTGNQAWGVAITENMANVTVARPNIDNVIGLNSYAGVLVSPSPTQDNTPVNNVTLIDVNPTNMGHGSNGASSSDIRIVDNGNLTTNVELIRCSNDVIYHTP